MSNKPFFSIVLPTLNRAKYLPFAIQSVLNQSFEDFELIVSDNFSTDETESVVREFSDKRVRYQKTEKKLPMGESWEFALSAACGEYITFLGDDDAHSRIYLESLKNIVEKHSAEIVACKMADYYYEATAEQHELISGDSLVMSPFTNELLVCEANEAIKNLFISLGLSQGSVSRQIQIPHLINTVYHNSVFGKIKNKFGAVFPSVLSTDYYLAVIVFSFIKNYYYLDAPLSFHGISNVSTTSSISSREKKTSLKKTQPELNAFKKVPFDFLIPYNFSADALLAAKSDLGEKLDYIDVDLTGYLVNIHQHLHALELGGNDVSAEAAEFALFVEKQDLKVKNQLRQTVLSKKNLLKNKLRRQVYDKGLNRFLSKLRQSDKRLILEGKADGFSGIVECANSVDYEFLQTRAIAKHKSKGLSSEKVSGV